MPVSLLTLAGIYLGLLWTPEPFFPYRVSYANLTLASDRPFDPTAGRTVLAQAHRNLSTSPLYDPHRPLRAFICNDRRTERFFFNRNVGAGGVCMVPIPSIFIRRSDVDGNRLMSPAGQPVPPPRDLDYYIAHEWVHHLCGARVGVVRYYGLPRWVREGLADYVARRDTFTLKDGLRDYRSGEPDMDPARSGRYDRYMLMVAYCLEVEQMPMERLLTAPPTQKWVEAAIGESVH